MEEYNAEYQAENDFVYKFQNGRYEVEHKVAETPQLYKYYSNSKYSFDAIRKMCVLVIYASSLILL